MIDVSTVDPRLYDGISIVIEKLKDSVGLKPENVLVVGASCRDILHAGFGHRFPLRATTDIDLGIAINDWIVSERIESTFKRIGSNGIRYLIAEHPVDIMPFGGVEDPDGISHPTARGEDLNVFGFQDVFQNALPLELPNHSTVKLPQPAGYTVLKMRSWLDRSVYGHYRDAQDLALTLFWYQESKEVHDHLYDTDEGFKILEGLGMDSDLAAAKLLALDAAAQLSPENAADLADRWENQDMKSLARNFTLPTTGPRTSDFGRREALIAQFSIS
ncbi:hypothetical protein V5R04_05380 [Jonesiaceae bacterium BS-20]|uniref:Nucleotidyltransferase n=1 Tax=Jonesiaceae bacterium BS-20 TaxID=3120821 RepID=A0AAU7E037_9MICO